MFAKASPMSDDHKDHYKEGEVGPSIFPSRNAKAGEIHPSEETCLRRRMRVVGEALELQPQGLEVPSAGTADRTQRFAG